MADDGGGRGKLLVRRGGGRFFTRSVDGTRSERDDVSGGVRIVDRVHGLHLVAGACAHVESVDVRVCESGGGSVFGLADSARARGPLYCDGKRDCCALGGSGYECE